MCTHRYTHGHRAFTNHFFFFLNFSAFLSLDSGKRSVGPREAYTANKTKRFVGEEVGVPLVAGEDAISRVSALCVCVCVGPSVFLCPDGSGQPSLTPQTD